MFSNHVIGLFVHLRKKKTDFVSEMNRKIDKNLLQLEYVGEVDGAKGTCPDLEAVFIVTHTHLSLHFRSARLCIRPLGVVVSVGDLRVLLGQTQNDKANNLFGAECGKRS